MIYYIYLHISTIQLKYITTIYSCLLNKHELTKLSENIRSLHFHRIVFEARISSVMNWAARTTSAACFLNTSSHQAHNLTHTTNMISSKHRMDCKLNTAFTHTACCTAALLTLVTLLGTILVLCRVTRRHDLLHSS